MAKDTKKGARRKLLETARRHEQALQAAGLPAGALDRFESALKGVEAQAKGPSPAAQVLIRDVKREVDEVQAAIRKEFPGNASFQAVFKANEPMPPEPREVLALGRLVAREAPEYAQNLIKYAINAATVKHLSSLCDQLEKELGGADPAKDAKEAEEVIVEVAKRVFEGKAELSDFAK